MKVGLSAWSIHQNCGRGPVVPEAPLDVFGVLEKARLWKLDCLQIEQFPEDPETLARIRGKAEEYGIELEVEFYGVDVTSVTAKLDVAKALGARVVRSFVGLNRYRTDTTFKEQFEAAVSNAKAIAQYAERIGVYFAIENHQDAMLGEIRSQDVGGYEVAALLDRVNSPFVGCCLDVGNCLAFLEDPILCSEVLAPKVLTMHVKDFRLKRAFCGAEIAGCTLGQGAVDVKRTIELVAQKSVFGKDTCLHIESPVERIEIRFLDPYYWKGYEKDVALRLPHYLEYLAERGEPAENDFRTPVELGWKPEEIFAQELAQAEASVEYVRSIAKEM